MSVPLLESRVTSLESLMADLIGAVHVTQRNVDQLSLEMRDFKDEMLVFKDGMTRFQYETERDRRAFNKRLGEIVTSRVA